MIYSHVLPADRDVYNFKRCSDLPWAQLNLLRVPGNAGRVARWMFYRNKTFVVDPTSITGDPAAVRRNVYEVLDWTVKILIKYQVSSVTVILNGNIWQYYGALVPLARLVHAGSATLYVNGRSYTRALDLTGAPNRVNIITQSGYPCAFATLVTGLFCGRVCRQDNVNQLEFWFNRQKIRLRDLSRMFPRALTTSFRLPGHPNALPGHTVVPHALSLAAFPGLPSALMGLAGAGLAGLSTDVVVYLGPANVMYQSFQAASFALHTYSWNEWVRMSEGRIASGPFASPLHRTWVTNTLLPALTYYHHVLWTETRSIWAYQANNPTISTDEPLPLPLLSVLGTQEGFGTWIGLPTRLSAKRRLWCLHQERMTLRTFLARMRPYGLNHSAHPASRFTLTIDGITRV
jgi:hypothetical protein